MKTRVFLSAILTAVSLFFTESFSQESTGTRSDTNAFNAGSSPSTVQFNTIMLARNGGTWPINEPTKQLNLVLYQETGWSKRKPELRLALHIQGVVIGVHFKIGLDCLRWSISPAR